MHIERDDSAISWDAVVSLFRAVGWGDRSPIEVAAAFARSTFKAFVFEASELVGFVAPAQFYRRLGWRPQTTAMIRRSEEQARLNCPEEGE
jgi:hypothetical protein